MKKLKFFSLALVALTLGACSSDDVVVNDQPGTVPAGEPGYVSLAINLPTQPSTRANDNFSNGDAEEYKVNTAYLFLFAGSSEANATYQSGYVLPTSTWNDQAEGSNITTRASFVKEITKPTTGENDNIYALVVLNGEGVIGVSGTEGAYQFTYGSNQLTSTTTLTDLTSTNALTPNIATVANRTSSNFLMSNAPLFSVAGGTSDPSAGNVSTFAVIDPDNIYSTQAEAERNTPAADIYVERAVAKVTMDAGDGTTTVDHLTYKIAGWDLDVTNNSTFLVRNVAPTTSWWGYKATTSNDYRFVGSNTVATNLYRTYWGIDPNYTGGLTNYGQNPFDVHEGETYEDDDLASVDDPLYCFENTFDVENMRQNQTTQVVVAADFSVDGAADNGDFYTLRRDKSIFYQEAAVIKAVKEAYLSNPQIATAIENATMVDDNTEIGEGDLTVTFDDKNENGGYVTVTGITLTDDARAKFADGEDEDSDPDVPAILEAANNGSIVTAISNDLNIALYKGGRAYYHAMIRHFDDTQAPWSAENVSGSDSYGNPANEANYLGRWGVLRNNWYQISVRSIAQLGEPEVPSIPGSYDDPTESWVRVQINVLSWAVRTQNADL